MIPLSIWGRLIAGTTKLCFDIDWTCKLFSRKFMWHWIDIQLICCAYIADGFYFSKFYHRLDMKEKFALHELTISSHPTGHATSWWGSDGKYIKYTQLYASRQLCCSHNVNCVVDYTIVCYEASLHLYNYVACSLLFNTYKQFKFVTYDHPCIYFIVDVSKKAGPFAMYFGSAAKLLMYDVNLWLVSRKRPP